MLPTKISGIVGALGACAVVGVGTMLVVGVMPSDWIFNYVVFPLLSIGIGVYDECFISQGEYSNRRL